MRVISGDVKSRKLKTVPGTGTRPTTDKIRESIFNIIGPFFEGGVSLDLYGGSGALTIEGLSRGIDKAVIIDVDPKAIAVIRENVKACRYQEQVEIYRNDASRALKALQKRDILFRYVFLDPPYPKQKVVQEIEYLHINNLLEKKAILVVEHDATLTFPEKVGSCVRYKHEQYNNTTAVTIYINELQEEPYE